VTLLQVEKCGSPLHRGVGGAGPISQLEAACVWNVRRWNVRRWNGRLAVVVLHAIKASKGPAAWQQLETV
jgi:hypothetical protein